MPPWRDALAAKLPPDASLASREGRLTALEDRNHDRLEALLRLRAASHALQDELNAALAPPMAPVGAWRRLRLALGLDQPPIPGPDELWARHERALARVRALGLHLDALGRELVLLDDDLKRLHALRDEAAADREATGRTLILLAAESAATPKGGADADALLAARLRWEAARGRASAQADRAGELLTACREQGEAMGELHQALIEVHSAGTRTLDALAQHLGAAVATSTSRELAAHADQALAALSSSLTVAVDLADSRARHCSERADALALRLEEADADARARRAAAREVEAALGGARG